jgi:4-hydroxyphenylpyruvate dioxygenase
VAAQRHPGQNRVVTTALDTAADIGLPVLSGTDHVELWVGNARQAAFHYRQAFGFDVVAYAGPETGVRDRASYVLQQGKVRLVLTAPLGPEGEIAAHVQRHGDGVRAIALRVDDATAAFEAATRRGARAIQEPARAEDAQGVLTYATIATYGDTVHTFVERDEYVGVHWPGFREDRRDGGGVGLRFIDHTVGNVEKGRMEDWVSFYSEVFGFAVFQEFDEHDVATQYSALRSKVTRDPRTQVTFPINEPYVGIKKSQIQEYLDYYRGSGVQHIALHTDDVVGTVQHMKDRGVEFLDTPDAYYSALGSRADGIDEDLDRLRDLRILIDRDDDGYLLQIFTRPVADRPTLFFEVIQRKGCKGFGKGNFKALFEAIEREQAARGNL